MDQALIVAYKLTGFAHKFDFAQKIHVLHKKSGWFYIG